MNKYAGILDTLEKSISDATPEGYPELIGELARLQATVWGRMLSGHASGNGEAQGQAQGPNGGRYLKVQEVVDRFGVTARWLYRNKKKLPHSQPSRKVLLFPEAALQRWFKKRS